MPDTGIEEAMELLCSNFRNRSSDDAFQDYITISFLHLFQYKFPSMFKVGARLLAKYNVNDHIMCLWKNSDKSLLKLLSCDQIISVIAAIEKRLYAVRLVRVYPINISALTISDSVLNSVGCVLTDETFSRLEVAVYGMYKALFMCVNGLKPPWSSSVSDQGIASSILWNFTSTIKLFCDIRPAASMKRLWEFLTVDSKMLTFPPPPRYVQDVVLRAFTRFDWSLWSPSISDIEYVLQILSLGNPSPVLLEVLFKILADVPWDSIESSLDPSFHSLFLRFIISLSYASPSPSERISLLVQKTWSMNWNTLSPNQFKDILSGCIEYVNELSFDPIEQSSKCYETIFIVRIICGIRLSYDLPTFKQADEVSDKLPLFVRFFVDIQSLAKAFFAPIFEAVAGALLEVYLNTLMNGGCAGGDVLSEPSAASQDAMGSCIVSLFTMLNHPVFVSALDHAIRNFLLKVPALVPRFVFFVTRTVHSIDNLVVLIENYLNIYFFALSDWEPIFNSMSVKDVHLFSKVALERGAPLCLVALL